MTRRRLLNLRFYRSRPKLRSKMYVRMFGRLAKFRVVWRKWRSKRAAGLSVLAALIHALTAKRVSNRFQLKRTAEHWAPPEKNKPTRRRIRWRKLHHRAHGMRQMERFGLDVTGDPAAVADARRLMRNARKAERRA